MSKLIKSLSLWTFILICSSVQAQKKKYEWKTASEGNYSYSYVTNDPIGARFYKLKNGMTVIMSVNRKLPRIQAYFSVKAGSKHDPKNNTGLAHYLEHLLFKGTDKYGSLDWSKENQLLIRIDSLYEVYNVSRDVATRKKIYSQIDQVSGEAAKYAIPNEYDKLMKNMGAQDVNAGTSYDQTVYQEDLPNNVVDKYLTVQAERFRNPVFRLFHTELETVYEEKNMDLAEEFWKTLEEVLGALLPHHNYGQQSILGSTEHLKNPSLKAIREFYNAYYVPNNMAVVLSGDFNPSELIKKVDSCFAFMKAKEVPQYAFGKEPVIEQPIVREVLGPKSESLTLGFRFQGAASKDAQLLTIISKILTNGSAGLIDLNLVGSQKLLNAWAYPLVLKDYAVLLLTGDPSQEQTLDDVRDLLLAELKKLRNGEFPDDLIKSIVNNERRDKILEDESYNSRAEKLSSIFTQEVDWANVVGYTDRLANITKNDVIDFAKKYLTDKNYVAVYKRQAVDSTIVKVEKPVITPISININDQSAFLKTVNDMPEIAIQPVWIDFEKEISKAKLHGLDVRAVENKENSLFMLFYHYPGGNWDSKLSVLALDYLNFLGTKEKTNDDFRRELYKMASNYSVSMTSKETYLSVYGLDENFEETVSLLHDLIKNSTANPHAFKAFILGVKQNRLNAKKDESIIGQGLRSYAMFGPQNPFNYTLSNDELDQIKEVDLLKILHDLTKTKYTIYYYGPRSIARLLEKIPAMKEQSESYVIPKRGHIFKEQPTDSTQVLFADYKMAQVDVFWHRTSELYNAEQVPVIYLFNSYFGEGMNSVVFQTIRESQGLAYATAAFLYQPENKDRHRAVIAYLGTQPDKFNEAIISMNQLLNVLPASKLSLEAAKKGLLKSLTDNRITGEELLWSFLANEKLGHQSDMRKIHFEKITKLDFEDLKQFHKEEFSQKPYIYCIVGDQELVDVNELKKLGNLKILSATDIFGY